MAIIVNLLQGALKLFKLICLGYSSYHKKTGLLMQVHNQSEMLSEILDYLNMIFTGVFTVEFVLKLFAFRLKVCTN